MPRTGWTRKEGMEQKVAPLEGVAQRRCGTEGRNPDGVAQRRCGTEGRNPDGVAPTVPHLLSPTVPHLLSPTVPHLLSPTVPYLLWDVLGAGISTTVSLLVTWICLTTLIPFGIVT